MTPEEAHAQLGRMFFTAKRFDRAIDELRRAVRENPCDADSLSMLSLALSYDARARAGRKVALSARRVDPEYAWAHYALATAYLNLGRPDLAEDSCREAVRLAPSNAECHSRLAWTLLKREDYHKAFLCAEGALRLDPQSSEALVVRSEVWAYLDVPGWGVKELYPALQREPDDAYLHAHFGWVLWRYGNRDKAARHFRESLRIDPNHEWVQDCLKQVEREGGQRTRKRNISERYIPAAVFIAGFLGSISVAVMASDADDRNPAIMGAVLMALLGGWWAWNAFTKWN